MLSKHGGVSILFCMTFQGDSIFWVEVEKIVPNPFQPRREFNQEKLQELADSIRMYGVLQPLTVTRKEVHRDDGTFFTEYELIAGERRLRASKLAKVEQVPVIIRSGEQTEQEKLELAIIENLQREDLNAVDRALAFKQLADAFSLSITQVAKKVGRSREYVSNSIRLLALPDHILDSVKTGDITEGHGRTLLMLKDKPEELEVIYKEILLKKLSVREVERIARKIASDKVRKKSWANTDAHLIEMEREFTDTLGTRVQISKTDYGGKLTIDYFTESELEKLLHVIKSQRTLLEKAGVESDTAPVIQELAEAESALQALTRATPLQTEEVALGAESQTPEPTQATETAPQPTQPSDISETTPPPSSEMNEANVPMEEASTVVSEPVQEPVAYNDTADVQTPPERQDEAFIQAPAAVPDHSDTVVEPPVSPEASQQPTVPQYQAPASVAEHSPAPDAYQQEPTPTEPAQPNPHTFTPEPAAGRQAATEAAPTPHTNPSVTETSQAPEPVRKPRVVATFNDKKTFIIDTEAPAPQAAARTQAVESSIVPGPASDAPVTPESPADPSSDDDLYSINRFSI